MQHTLTHRRILHLTLLSSSSMFAFSSKLGRIAIVCPKQWIKILKVHLLLLSKISFRRNVSWLKYLAELRKIFCVFLTKRGGKYIFVHLAILHFFSRANLLCFENWRLKVERSRLVDDNDRPMAWNEHIFFARKRFRHYFCFIRKEPRCLWPKRPSSFSQFQIVKARMFTARLVSSWNSQ